MLTVLIVKSLNLYVRIIDNPYLNPIEVDKDLIYRVFNSIIVISVISFVIYSCNTGNSPGNSDKFLAFSKVNDSILISKEVKKESALIVNYFVDTMDTRQRLDSFKNKYTLEQQHIIYALNRMDAGRLRKGKVIVIPDTLTGSLKDYSPFPHSLGLLDSIPKTVLVNQRIQGFALYENGNLVKWGPISSGKRSTQTPNGLNYGNYKARRKISTINSSWVMPYYFNFMNFEGVGMHKYALPGYPASHACVRVRKEDAKYVYEWANMWELTSDKQEVKRNGTPFMVFGNYDFDKPVPWLNLAEDREDNFLNQAEKDTLKAYVETYFKDEKNFAKPEGEENKLVLPMVNELETIE